MIGPKISKKLDRKVVEMRNVKVTLHRGLHHTVDLETAPDVVIGGCLCDSQLVHNDSLGLSVCMFVRVCNSKTIAPIYLNFLHKKYRAFIFIYLCLVYGPRLRSLKTVCDKNKNLMLQ